jgi:hypothetical protein
MENCKSTVYSYPKAYGFMKKNGAQKSHATVPLRDRDTGLEWPLNFNE